MGIRDAIGPIVDEPRSKVRVKTIGAYVPVDLTKRIAWFPEQNTYAPIDGILRLLVDEVMDCYQIDAPDGRVYILSDQFAEQLAVLTEKSFIKLSSKDTTYAPFWFEEVWNDRT